MAETASGFVYTLLGNQVSDAINAALRMGLEIDEAVCVVAQVAADYARLTYGNAYLPKLADVVIKRAEMPAPTNRSEGGGDG